MNGLLFVIANTYDNLDFACNQKPYINVDVHVSRSFYLFSLIIRTWVSYILYHNQ